MMRAMACLRSTVLLRFTTNTTIIQNLGSCSAGNGIEFLKDNQAVSQNLRDDSGVLHKLQIGKNVSGKDKTTFIVNTLFDLKESKEAVYGALDAWVAWEQSFPIGPLRRALTTLEKEQQWHRIVQVIKWMLSKGQGTTMGTYEQLIRALDMDHRAEEAHKFWEKKIGHDLHSVPWKLCRLMISIYHRNSMLERLVKLFKGLEAFDRKPPEKSIVKKVADAYEMSGLLEDQKRLLEKYDYLLSESWKEHSKNYRKVSRKTEPKAGKRTQKKSEASGNGSPQSSLACVEKAEGVLRQ